MAVEPAEEAWEVEVLVGPLPEPLADRLRRALMPESSSGVPGSRVEVARRPGGVVELRLEARGTSGVRATLNSHLRWVDLALRVDDLASRTGPRPSHP